MYSILSSNLFFITKKVLAQITLRRKRQLFALFLLMIISSIAAMLNLGLIVPFLAIISDTNTISSIPILKYLTNFYDTNNILLPIAFIFSLTTILSVLIRLLTLWFTNILAAGIGSDLSCKGFNNILNQDYEDFIYENSSNVINALTGAINKAVNYLRYLLEMFASLIIIIGLSLSLLVIEPNIFLGTIILIFSFYFLLLIFTKNYLRNSGKIINDKTIELIKLTQESTGAIINIKLDNKFTFFEELYRSFETELRKKIALSNFLSQFPRLVLEGLAIIFIIFLALVISRGNAESFALGKLGVLAFAAQKILPEIQKLYLGWSQLEINKSSVIEVLRIVEKNTNTKKTIKNLSKFSPKRIIKFENVSYSYPNDNLKVLKNIDLQINIGEKIGIIGKSGSGKSTFLNILMALLKPTSGNIYLDNLSLHSTKEKSNLIQQYQLSISYVPQNYLIIDGTVLENIAYAQNPKFYDIDRILWAAEVAQIKEFIINSDLGLNMLVGEKGINLSGGQRQRIALARAIYKGSQILILDEATSSLDINTEEIIFKNLYNLNTTTFIVSHKNSNLRSCDTILKIENGIVKINN